jgi:hemerythrin
MSDKPGSDDDLHLGIEEVDREHGLQIALIDELEKAGSSAEAAGIAQRLHDTTEAHFIGEEMLMRQHSYPLYHAHIEEHGKLLTELASLRERHGDGEAGSLAGLREWLRGHIRGPDRDFATFAKSVGSAANTTRG